MNQEPSCLFIPTYKACKEHNSNMPSALGTKLESFTCIDEIDETNGTHKWSKKAADALKKANSDCNLTAGLEDELIIAVGARVMLEEYGHKTWSREWFYWHSYSHHFTTCQC